MTIAKIIKYEGDNTTFVWKSPIEDFNSMSQLIVHQSQEALFFKNGQILDVFEAGRHTLQTENIPLVRRFLSLPTGGKTPFHCEVYFVNMVQQMAIKWGTDSQVQYMEPSYGFPLQIGLSGEMVLSVRDSRRLLLKLVGTESNLTQNGIVSKFRSYLMSIIKPFVASTMQTASYSIFEVDAHMDEFSSSLKDKLTQYFTEYGVNLDKFFVTNIAKPDGEKAYEEFKNLHVHQYTDVAQAQLNKKIGIIEQQTEAEKMLIESKAISQKRVQEGYTYQQERGFDVSEMVAKNEAIGGLTNVGVGLGTMMGVGGAIGGMVSGAISESTASTTPPANQQTSSINTFALKLEKVKLMKENGLLSDDEFELLKKALLESL